MSWLWGSKGKAEGEERLEGNETLQDSSHLSQSDGDDDSDDDSTNKDDLSCDDEESSVESSVEDASDSDEDDDSLVVNLIENMSTDDDPSDDDISMIEVTPNDTTDDSFDSESDDEDDAESTQSSNRGGKDNVDGKPSNEVQDLPTSKNKDDSNVDDADNDDPVTSFWEKQSLLVLAAEHDRVDILKALLKDENEEKDTLLNYGIPPLHLAISFGSVNTAQSLLRMGADPSVRPNIDEVLEDRRNQPEDSKVDIPNIRRFEMITAWELAFGNAAYEEKLRLKKTSTPWSLFGSTANVESEGKNAAVGTATAANNKIIKPVDMPPSKREGIRHAFTAEALRSVGSDEVDRLKQLVASGMPANIDIGGKDLYGWAIEMEALKCEEFLRPVEAAKYDEKANSSEEKTTESPGSRSVESPADGSSVDMHKTSTKHAEHNKNSSSFVVHRPVPEETVPQLKNRLDELNSLSTALSVCLDNLAEEVSVCHGLLLMGGGASALASHVRSLRDSKTQKLNEMEDIQLECLDVERELADLVHSTGDIGKEVVNIANTNFLTGGFEQRVALPSSNTTHTETSETEKKSDIDMEQLDLKALIAASENKIRKLRASIADLSEENTRNLKEVKRRGLEGGINLVRGLREELRDLDYQLSEVRSMKSACKAKISMILARVQNRENKRQNENGDSDLANTTTKPEIEGNDHSESHMASGISNEITDVKRSDDNLRKTNDDGINDESPINKIPNANHSIPPPKTISPVPKERSSQESKNADDQAGAHKVSASTKIATGDSQAIAIIQPGNKGFFTVDLWEVILRIIGYERAANRRSIQNATKSTSSSRPNVMII